MFRLVLGNAAAWALVASSKSSPYVSEQAYVSEQNSSHQEPKRTGERMLSQIPAIFFKVGLWGPKHPLQGAISQKFHPLVASGAPLVYGPTGNYEQPRRNPVVFTAVACSANVGGWYFLDSIRCQTTRNHNISPNDLSDHRHWATPWYKGHCASWGLDATSFLMHTMKTPVQLLPADDI